MNTASQPAIAKHRPINSYQLQLLITLYKFRFSTAQLIASSQGSKYTRVILARLKILIDQGYIGQNYDSSYKIIGKPAVYYLLPKGIRVLRQQSFADSKVLKRIYYDKNATDEHITHRLNVFRAYISIKQKYPKVFQFYSKSELASWKYIPRDLTDAYLKRNDNNKSVINRNKPEAEKLTANYYFMSYYEASIPYWRLKSSIKRYIAYAESERWQKTTKKEFPKVLLVCDGQKQAYKLQKLTVRELDTTYADIKFVITTPEDLSRV